MVQFFSIPGKKFHRDTVFYGLMILIANLGASHMIQELPETKRQVLRGPHMRKLTVFAITYIWSHDVYVSLLMAILYTIWVDYM